MKHCNEAIAQFKKTGLLVIESAVSHALCDLVAEDLERHAQAQRQVNGHGQFNGRFVNFHASSKPALEMATTPLILDFLPYLLGFQQWAAYTSLAFYVGTEQPIHRDCPHFYTWPEPNRFAGVWYALEDATAENGALEYFEGGHEAYIPNGGTVKNILYPKRTTPLQKAELDRCMEHYNELCTANPVQQRFEKKQVEVKKGDVVIWHPALPHGGGKIVAGGATRKSMVVHCIPENTRVYNAEYFFEEKPLPANPKLYEYGLHKNGRPYVLQPPTFVQKDYI